MFWKRKPAETPGLTIPDRFARGLPSDQAAVDLFSRSWVSAVPVEGVSSGSTPLFDDPRVSWLLDGMGDLAGASALELGPLEGGHTRMLLERGVGHVLAVEANVQAFLRCLVVKNLLDLANAKFQLGNFAELLAERARRYDLILAVGVLYHMEDPLKLLRDMAASTDRISIWSPFFDATRAAPQPGKPMLYTGRSWTRTIEGDSLTYHQQTYGELHNTDGFLGGVGRAAIWLELDQVVAFLETRGFHVTIGHRTDDHAAGHPTAALRACR